MKIVRITRDFNLNQFTDTNKELKAGKSYLFSTLLVTQLSYVVPENMGIALDISAYYKEYKGEDLNGKTLLCWRHGGIGDLMFMMPPLRLLKERYPDCRLQLAIGRKYFDIYRNVPYVDTVFQLPVELDVILQADYHLQFEKIIEGNKEAERLNAYDLFLRKFGFDYGEIDKREKRPDIFLTTLEIEFAKKLLRDNFPPHVRPLIGVQVASSTPVRTFPFHKIFFIVDGIVSRGGGVVLFGGPGQKKLCNNIQENFNNGKGTQIVTIDGKAFNKKDLIINGPNTNMTLRQSMAVASQLDVIICPDSSMVHIAGAIGVPIVGLYGPFPADLRMRYYHNAIGLNAGTACSPCFTHTHGPCPKGAPSPCFSLIDTEQVLIATDILLRTTQNSSLPKMDKLRPDKFLSVIEKCSEYMTGRGLDLGSGFARYLGPKDSPKFNVITVDQNPLCEPKYIADIFSPDIVKAMENLGPFDFIISSISVNTEGELNKLVESVDQLLKVNGFFILQVSEKNIVSKVDTSSELMSKYLISFFKSQLTYDEIRVNIESRKYYLCLEHIPTGDLSSGIDPAFANFASLSIWKKYA